MLPKLAEVVADGQNYNLINMTFPLKIVGLLKTKVDTTAQFKITINTALGTGNSFQLPLPSGHTYNFVVYWGDGNFDTITAYNQAETLHSYSSGGVYQIAIEGKCGGWSFNNGGDKLKVISIDAFGNINPDNDGFVGGFYGCSRLATISEVIPYSNLTDFEWMFGYCSSLTSLPNGFLDACVNATSFYRTFQGCYLLTIPNNFFYYNSNVTNYQQTFYAACRNTVLPSSIFNLSNLSIVTTFQYFMYALNTSYSFTGSVQDIWTYAPTANHTRCFHNQTSLSNYASIPSDWK